MQAPGLVELLFSMEGIYLLLVPDPARSLRIFKVYGIRRLAPLGVATIPSTLILR